jgi:HPt (histidine-containing phosphotransfer) domain-containing protein
MTGKITVSIARDYEDLIPGFLANRGRDLQRMLAALETGDFDGIRFSGHGLKGLGSTYGFDAISDLGERIEDAALAEDAGAINRLLSEFRDYLERLQVVFE